MTVADLEALLVESEVDIRTADRDLREIAELESKGVLDAGKLPSEWRATIGRFGSHMGRPRAVEASVGSADTGSLGRLGQIRVS